MILSKLLTYKLSALYIISDLCCNIFGKSLNNSFNYIVQYIILNYILDV